MIAQHLSRFAIDRMLSRLTVGTLTLETPSGATIVHRGAHPGPNGILILHRWRALQRLVLLGDIGFAESYIDGDWSSPDLTSLLELGAVNVETNEGFASTSIVKRLVNRLRHWRRLNTKRGSRRNIVAHYDLGNEFYARWLDEGMNYSSGVFTDPCDSLETAQRRKNDEILDRLRIGGGERVLEIGCGWGALAERMVRRGCDVTGITLSPSQLDYAQRRVARASNSACADIRLQDYRDLRGTFDRIVSVEMIEAVGEAFWPTYFSTIRRCLAPGGRALIQAITIDPGRFDSYRNNVDFIQRHVFPGGMLPSPDTIRRESRKAGLVVAEASCFGQSYARTLAEWRTRFQSEWPGIEAMGFPPAFKRLWEYYLSYCEAGFRSGATDVGHYVLMPAEGMERSAA